MMQSSPLFSSAEFSTNTVRATSTVTATIQKQLNVYENLDNCLGYYSTSKVVQRILRHQRSNVEHENWGKRFTKDTNLGMGYDA